MHVLILAGGLGTRLQSVVKSVPKPMAPIHNRPFLEYLMRFWKEHGATHFYLSIGYLAETIESHFKESYQGIPITRIVEKEPLGTGGGLLYALDQINLNEDLIVVNGDTYFEIDPQALKAFHMRQESKLTLGLREVLANDRYSGVQLDEKGRVKHFAKREEGSSHLLINAGVYILDPLWIKAFGFDPHVKCSLEDDLFPQLIESNQVYGFASNGRFIDIGIPKDYERAQHFFAPL